MVPIITYNNKKKISIKSGDETRLSYKKGVAVLSMFISIKNSTEKEN